MGNVSDHTKCISSSNQLCMDRPTLIDINPNECNQELSYYSFIVNSDRCNGSWCKVILLMIYLEEYVFQTKQRL